MTLFCNLFIERPSYVERGTKIMHFEKVPKVCDVRFCTNVFRQSVLVVTMSYMLMCR